jgi:hypothetical protein
MTAPDSPLLPPRAGLIASRIALEYGGTEQFTQTLERALARAGSRGATIVAYLDRGDLAIRLPPEDGPCWNAVPLMHLHPGLPPAASEWATANAVLEKLERYR